MREMNSVRIGLPSFTEEALERLAEDCEAYISQYLLERIPEKSIENMFISCSLALQDGQLDVDIQIDIDQSYDTGHSLDDLTEEAGEAGSDWLEKQLVEMKAR